MRVIERYITLNCYINIKLFMQIIPFHHVMHLMEVCFCLGCFLYLCSQKAAKLGGASAIGARSIAFGLHELCSHNLTNSDEQ
jgi:hypothetical protein